MGEYYCEDEDEEDEDGMEGGPGHRVGGCERQICQSLVTAHTERGRWGTREGERTDCKDDG